jgi:beta-glucosidase
VSDDSPPLCDRAADDIEDNEPVGRVAFTANVTQRDLVSYYLPAWRAAAPIAKSTMCSYNAIDINDGRGGVPACGNDLMMNQIYREQFLFSGFIVSDCDSIGEPSFEQYIGKRADTQGVGDLERWYAEAAAGVSNGCDMDCGQTYWNFLPGAARSERRWINRSTIDRSVARIAEHTMMLGLMDGEGDEISPYESYGAGQLDTAEHRQLARLAATQSIVLMRNGNISSSSGDQRLLPFSPSANRTRLFVGGPNANDSSVLLSNYHGSNNLPRTRRWSRCSAAVWWPATRKAARYRATTHPASGWLPAPLRARPRRCCFLDSTATSRIPRGKEAARARRTCVHV